MNKKLETLLIAFIFLLTIINSTALGKQIENKTITSISNKNIIYVDDNNTAGPWDGTMEHPYRYIYDGVSNASDNDTVYVFNGVYNETLTINKHITIQGEKQNSTIIDGMYKEFIIHIVEDNVSIMNLTLRNSGGYRDNAGIKISSENNSIKDCTIYRTKTGIYINNTSDNEINNCSFYTNGEGIFVCFSSKNSIKNCQFYHNAIGVNFQSSEDNKICDSYAHTNGVGFFLNDSSNIEIIHCAVSDNNDNQGGVFIFGCSSINITNCNICHNGVGVTVANSSYISIKRCDINWNTHIAIKLGKSSDNITISNCEIRNNFRYAIHIENGNCKIIDNNIYKNALYGLYAKFSYSDARYNWWGFFTGPTYTGLGIADRITRKLGSILYLPWYRQPLQNIGSNWETNDFFTKKEITDTWHKHIDFSGNDTDKDGCPDWWEEKYGYNPNIWNDHEHLDPDGDGLNNIEECYTDQYGSNPFHKDVFLEFDWAEAKNPETTNKPPSDQIDLMKSAFEKHNIALHVDVGGLEGGEEIPYISNFSYATMRDLYWDYFLHNDLDNPRKGIFHYCLVCDYGPGAGFAFVGWDNLDSFEISAQQLVEGFPAYSRERLIVTGAMHETGHTFGLFVDDFAGIDNAATERPYYKEFWLYINYRSCMSYQHTWAIMDYSDGTHIGRDFDDWDNLDFTFFKNTHFEWPKK